MSSMISVQSSSYSNPDNDCLPNLQTLILGNINWASLADFLLKKRDRFPELKQIRVSDQFFAADVETQYIGALVLREFFEVDRETTRMWFDVIHDRRLKVFPSDISFWLFAGDGPFPTLSLDLVQELLIGLSRPFGQGVVPAVHDFDLSKIILDKQTFDLLLTAIERGNFFQSVKDLSIILGPDCDVSSFKKMGSFLRRGFLPSLKSFGLAKTGKGSGSLSLRQCWEAFFAENPFGFSKKKKPCFHTDSKSYRVITSVLFH